MEYHGVESWRVSEKSFHLSHEGFINLIFSLHAWLGYGAHLGWVSHSHNHCGTLLFLPLAPSQPLLYPPPQSSRPGFLMMSGRGPRHSSALVPAHPQSRGHEAGDLCFGVDDLWFGRDGRSAGTCSQAASSRSNRSDVGALFDGGCVVTACACGGCCSGGRGNPHGQWGHVAL